MKSGGIASLRPRDPILEAVERLRAELEKVSDPADRQQVVNVLEGIADFIGSLMNIVEANGRVEIVHPAYEAIRALSTALGELKYGIVDPILKPNPAGSRHPDPARQREVRQMAVAFYRTLREEGISAEIASRNVARALNDSEFTRRGTRGRANVTALTVRNWSRRNLV